MYDIFQYRRRKRVPSKTLEEPAYEALCEVSSGREFQNGFADPPCARLSRTIVVIHLLFLILIFLFLSCATAPIYHSIENISPQWEVFADGISYLHGKISSPRIEFHALRIDLSSPNVNIFVSGEPNIVSDFVKNNNLIAGINASPFDKNHKNVGLVISGGVILSSAVNQYDILIFYKDKQITRAAIVNQASIYSTDNIENAVGGFHQILKDGIPAQRTLREGTVSSERHPRSAAGVNTDGSVLYLLAADGRRPGSIGVHERELAILLRALGCHDGINLDGGGSTAMALRSPDGNVRVVNTPSNFGRERKVAACIGISLSTEK